MKSAILAFLLTLNSYRNCTMYIIEGNIGAGKSTFLRLMGERLPEIKAVYEPIHNWQNTIHGQSLLTNFYQDPKRWAYTLELLTMISRVQDHLKIQNDESPNIVERSIYSGYYCFARNSYAEKFMTDIEWKIYEEWFSLLIPHQCLPPKGFIYLKVSPEVAYERIKKRNRYAEKTLTFAYLKQIHRRHEHFLIKKEGILPHLKRIPVLIIDCNNEFENNSKQLDAHLQLVTAFLHQTGTPIERSANINHQSIAF